MERFMNELESKLRANGVDHALQWLNRRTGCRFTAVFELREDQLFNRHFHDRQGEPRAAFLESVPWVDSFCQIAVRDGQLSSHDTANDHRLDYSPYRALVTSYHAVPLWDEALGVWGTLCHFDVVTTMLTDQQFEELRRAARILLPYVQAEARKGAGSA